MTTTAIVNINKGSVKNTVNIAIKNITVFIITKINIICLTVIIKRQ